MDQFDCAIVGGGPAGCSAAITAKSLGMSVVLVEREAIGGRVRHIGYVDNYLGQVCAGERLVADWAGHLQSVDVPILAEEVVAVQKDKQGWTLNTSGGRTISTREVVIATGTRDRKLEEHPAVIECRLTHNDVFFHADVFSRVDAEHNVCVIGCDRPLETYLRSAVERGMRNFDRMTVVALPDRRYAFSRDQWPGIRVIDAEAVESVSNEDDKYRVCIPGGTAVMADLVISNVGSWPNGHIPGLAVSLDASGYPCSDPPTGISFAGDVVRPDGRRIAVAIGEGAQAALQAFYRREGLYGY